MNPTDIIAKKRDGERLSQYEISEIVRAYAADGVDDCQMAALAMAIFIRGIPEYPLGY